MPKGEAREAARARRSAKRRRGPTPPGAVLAELARLAPYNSYGDPDFVRRGYYLDRPFRCAGCGREQIWTAAQQKWWYEVARGYVYSTAKLCRPRRRREQARKAEARGTQRDGAVRKRTAER